MNKKAIIARNRVNAQNSTGPKTAAGKAKVAGNARRHGVTGRPDAESLSTWLRLILNEPSVSAVTFLPPDERGKRALALAKAEAHLAKAEAALHALEGEGGSQGAEQEDLVEMACEIEDETVFGGVTREDWGARYDMIDSILKKILRKKLIDERSACKKHRLFTRYVREARSRRKRAFSDWVAIQGEGATQS